MPYADPVKNSESKRLWRLRQRAAWFADKVCAHCGSREELELDHIDPALKVSHKIFGWAPARRDAELAKCQPLCHRCHKVKTKAQRRLKDACGKGHPYTPANTMPRCHGGRQCRICFNEGNLVRARKRGVQPSRKGTTHCIHGHEYTAANTYITKAGRYRCKACRTIDMRRRHAATRERIRTGLAVREMPMEPD